MTRLKTSGAFTPRTRFVVWTWTVRDMLPREKQKFGNCLMTWWHRRPALTRTTTVTLSIACRPIGRIMTVRCPSGELLVVATTEWFTQTFIVEYTAPDPAMSGVASVAVITSAMTVKRVGVYPQTSARTPQSPPPPPPDLTSVIINLIYISI
ncbi:unnamed protein product [Aphis gossypii]|uniref:Uncharacterized protein n=1 Tax=Aphis gossypii TaxID=80765 RepID=A0A9P0NJU1_APHGO|nr:unnamed protein product [Aphis gossypii]